MTALDKHYDGAAAAAKYAPEWADAGYAKGDPKAAGPAFSLLFPVIVYFFVFLGAHQAIAPRVGQAIEHHAIHKLAVACLEAPACAKGVVGRVGHGLHAACHDQLVMAQPDEVARKGDCPHATRACSGPRCRPGSCRR